MPSAPHFAAPFQLGRKGAAVVEQDSPGDLEARAFNVLVCPRGFREDNPEYGVPQLLFQTVPLNTGAVQAAVGQWAELDATVTEEEEALRAAVRRIEVGV